MEKNEIFDQSEREREREREREEEEEDTGRDTSVSLRTASIPRV